MKRIVFLVTLLIFVSGFISKSFCLSDDYWKAYEKAIGAIWSGDNYYLGQQKKIMKMELEKGEEQREENLKEFRNKLNNIKNKYNYRYKSKSTRVSPQSGYVQHDSVFYTLLPEDIANSLKDNESQEIENLLNRYDKEKIINLILKERDNHITLRIGNELRDFMGPPGNEYVTAETILIDLENMGLTVNEFENMVEANKKTESKGNIKTIDLPIVIFKIIFTPKHGNKLT